MATRWSFEVTDEQSRPNGPLRALDEAVAKLGPFKRANAEKSARAEVIELARSFIQREVIVRGAPRSKDIVQRLIDLQRSLRAVVQQIQSMDDFTRFHLREEDQSRVRARHRFDAEWLPEPASSNSGDFASLADEFAEFIDEPIATIRALTGGRKVVDLGGRQNHAERYLGSPKVHLVREAFELFDYFHPGKATSAEGGNFHTFVHSVYEFATAKHDEGKAGLGHLMKTLIRSLRQLKVVTQETQTLCNQLESTARDDAGYPDLTRRFLASVGRQSKLEAPFNPLLNHIVVRQPPRKRRR